MPSLTSSGQISTGMKVFIGILVLGVLAAIAYGIYQGVSGSYNSSTNSSSRNSDPVISRKNNTNAQNPETVITDTKQNSQSTSQGNLQ